MDDSKLHALVLQLLTNGQLPRDQGHGLVASYGRGQTCNACGNSMPAHAVVWEITVGRGDLAKVLALHVKCYDVWSAERARLSKPASPV
jgi:hypothetical protein